MDAITIDTARAAKAAAATEVARCAKVVGSGITKVDGEYAVKVNIAEPLPKGMKLPARIAGVRIVVEVVGAIRKVS